jgi:hypothetical protein
MDTSKSTIRANPENIKGEIRKYISRKTPLSAPFAAFFPLANQGNGKVKYLQQMLYTHTLPPVIVLSCHHICTVKHI